MKVSEYEEGKYNMEYDKFFCCCDEDGSITWIDSNGESNSLEEDGDMLIEKDIYSLFPGECYCHSCEKPLKPIMFNKVKKNERIKIYNMNDETRANWMKSCEIVDELEKQDISDRKFKKQRI